jgi:hypothetical protein
MSLRHRVARLERLHPPPPPPTQEELLRPKRWKQITDRLVGIIEQAAPLLNEAQQAQVSQGFEPIDVKCDGPYGKWLNDLLEARCRLPELAPEAGKDLLLAWLSPEAEGGTVCRQCGLEYPQHRHPPMREWKLLPGKTPMEGPPPWYDLPEFFRACPNCGASRYDMDWPHLIRDKYYPWMELDGFMGVGS